MKLIHSLSAALALAVFATSGFGDTVVDDNFAVDGTAVTDADYYGSSTSNAIEFNSNSIGLVSGSSGRQIHALFATQTLAAAGDKLTASIDFTTPATVAAGNEDIRVGFFDHLGRTGPTQLGQNTSYSSSSPNPDYSGLPGFYTEIDVESADPGTNFNVRSSNPSTTGRLLATSSGFTNVGSSPAVGYTVVANTDYTIDVMIERVASGDLEITTGFAGSSDTETITSPLSYDFGMLAMGSSSGAFGSSNSPGDPDNGIDITSFTLEFETAAIPEPGSATFLIGSLVSLGLVRRRN
jgi:hypothetical protein